MTDVLIKLEWFIQANVDEFAIWVNDIGLVEDVDWTLKCYTDPYLSFRREDDAVAFKVKFGL